MTREEHIAKAEELMREYDDLPRFSPVRVGHPTPFEVALAQVHATLALSCPPAEPDKPVPTEEDRERFRSRKGRAWWSR